MSSSSPNTGREVHLASRPVGEPVAGDFALVEVEVPAPGPGQVLVRNRWMSVDPYMRGRMRDVPSYVPPYAVGDVLTGGAVGEVVASRADGLAEGDLVLHGGGWREWWVGDADRATRLDVPAGVSPSAFLGVLGMTGLTAYAGLVEVAALRPGDAVFVAGASGAVGSVAGQLARLKGASRVVGSAGSPEKVRWLVDELGLDAAFDHHDGPALEQLRRVAPDGVDVCFDNVGGAQLEAALRVLRPHGRVALCGAISTYNDESGGDPVHGLGLAVGKRLTLRGFIVGDHEHLRPRFLEEVGGWLADGALRVRETVHEGIERAPEAFIGLFTGAGGGGKVLVRL
ncbi:NADP-dependent oxidoreductase [Vallicoccus soli]|uniref:NADP-dependent oxidoreductase n=1 Tax=Vallicoccus soli TaxID=2339232 RepID=A0A3A3Z1F4_9ACTN|nr:NADP-dependent oxidoreductase [Vallicoccus soli]RJK97085.1 NADP-dependent oxidoreductase [Vallicoccus soli]